MGKAVVNFALDQLDFKGLWYSIKIMYEASNQKVCVIMSPLRPTQNQNHKRLGMCKGTTQTQRAMARVSEAFAHAELLAHHRCSRQD